MAPIRRYLRITLHSVLEVRIYLDNPALADTWLLAPRDPVLPRVIAAIRPYVIPKLREENEKAKGKGSKKKRRGIKDVVQTDDFEVSIFLTETSTPHTLLTKQKTFKEKGRLKSNGKLGLGNAGANTDALNAEDGPDDNDDDDDDDDNGYDDNDDERPILVEEDEDDNINMNDIPPANSNKAEDAVVVPSDDDEHPSRSNTTRNGKRKRIRVAEETDAPSDDKKKMAVKTTYDGFSIYGRVLCLIVKRKGEKRASNSASGAASGSDMMENWVSTQAQQENVLEGGDE